MFLGFKRLTVLVIIFGIQAVTLSAAVGKGASAFDFHDQYQYLAKDKDDFPRSISPNWFYEMSGVYLSHQFLKDEDAARQHTVQFGLIDLSFDFSWVSGPFAKELTGRFQEKDGNEKEKPHFAEPKLPKNIRGVHSSIIVNLINGPAPTGIGINSLYKDAYVVNEDVDFVQVKAQFKEKPLDLIVFAGHFFSDKVNVHLKDLSEKARLVLPVGNYYPIPLSEDKKQIPGIWVGSVGPSGLVTLTTQKGAHILAPSDFFMRVAMGKDMLGEISETSGATGMVAGAVVNLISLLKRVSSNEIIELLQRTSLPSSLTFSKEKKDRVGILNVYKLMRVASAMKPKWDITKSDHSDLFKESAYFDFKKESEGILEIADSHRKLSNLKLAALNYWKAFLLDSNNVKARERLRQLYLDEGYTENAEYFDLWEPKKREANLKNKLATQEIKNVLPLSAARAVTHLLDKEDAKQLLMKTLQDTSNIGLKEAVIESSTEFGKDAHSVIESALEGENANLSEKRRLTRIAIISLVSLLKQSVPLAPFSDTACDSIVSRKSLLNFWLRTIDAPKKEEWWAKLCPNVISP